MQNIKLCYWQKVLRINKFSSTSEQAAPYYNIVVEKRFSLNAKFLSLFYLITDKYRFGHHAYD